MCFIGSGCATIVRTSSESIQIVTEPDTAVVSLSTGETCTSPCDLSVKRRDAIEVTVVKQGCTAEIVPFESRMDGTGQLITFMPIIFKTFIAYVNLVFGELFRADSDENSGYALAMFSTYGGVEGIVNWRSGAAFLHEPNPMHVALRCSPNDAVSE